MMTMMLMTKKTAMGSFCLLMLLSFAATAASEAASSQRQTSKRNDSSLERIVHRLLLNYDKTTPPHIDKPTAVAVGVYIMWIDIRDKSATMTIYLRQKWRDERLALRNVTELRKIRAYVWNDIWLPDTFFRNEKSSSTHHVTVDNRLLTIKDDGDIWYVMKLTLTLRFVSALQRFPFDNQMLPITIESFGHKADTMYFTTLESPVDIDANVGLNDFYLTDSIMRDCSMNYTSGAYPCLELRLMLRRAAGYYTMTVVFPSVVIVVLSWCSFFVPANLPTAKLTVGLVTALCSLAMSVLCRPLMAPTLVGISYVTCIDIWMTSCLLFVCCALIIQLVVVSRAANQQSQSRHGDSEKLTNRSKLDFIARIVFPIAFLLFAIIFWVVMSR